MGDVPVTLAPGRARLATSPELLLAAGRRPGRTDRDILRGTEPGDVIAVSGVTEIGPDPSGQPGRIDSSANHGGDLMVPGQGLGYHAASDIPGSSEHDNAHGVSISIRISWRMGRPIGSSEPAGSTARPAIAMTLICRRRGAAAARSPAHPAGSPAASAMRCAADRRRR
jgi:hypothetical protein